VLPTIILLTYSGTIVAASLADIKANDYNLNIPHYVHIFDAEESIDLNAIAAHCLN
jgi:type I restriction-modification system DNA methylase subunit